MRGVFLSACLAVSAVSAFNVTPAAARDYPYCLAGREIGYPGDCSYSNIQQCRASASGRNAGCTVNPRVAFQQRGDGFGNYGFAAPRERAYRRGYRSRYDRYDRRY